MSFTPKPDTMDQPPLPKPIFPLGQLVVTCAVLDCLAQANVSIFDLISRHGTADWGDVSAADWLANDRALQTGDRLLSVYHVGDKQLHVISEAGRVSTAFLTTEEF